MAPHIREMMPNLFQVQIPLPRNPLKVINSYFILDPERTLVVDLGFNLPECRQALFAALGELGRPWSSVQVLATHTHPDHIGLLDSLPMPEAPLLAGFSSIAEIGEHKRKESSLTFRLIGMMRHDAAAGALDEDTKTVAEVERLMSDPEEDSFDGEMVSPAHEVPVQKLNEGETVSAGPYHFTVMETPGHDPWHICLHDEHENIAIAGDHVLRRVTPAISTWSPEDDVLGDYLASLRRMPEGNNILGLPGHGKPISNLQAEARRIEAHHMARLEEFHQLVRAGYDNLATITANASWKYDDWFSWAGLQQALSAGESMAHLVNLEAQGSITIIEEGRYLYRFTPRSVPL